MSANAEAKKGSNNAWSPNVDCKAFINAISGDTRQSIELGRGSLRRGRPSGCFAINLNRNFMREYRSMISSKSEKRRRTALQCDIE